MERRKMDKSHMVFSSLMVTAGVSVCIWLAYLLCDMAFDLRAPWQYIVVGVLGLYFFFGAVKVGTEIHNKRHGRSNNFRNRLLDETLDALNRIASGDFTVMLEISEYDTLSELAESVNKMARELGSMESLRQDFISNVSHEIQSPLTSISGFAALLKTEGLDPQQRAHYLDVIETEARRLGKLSDNLLKLSSLESNVQPLTFAEFRMDKQIQNAALMLEPQWAGKQINLSLNLEKINYTGDESLLTQVWVNLLHNAIKFTHENGNIEVFLTQGSNEINFRIEDTGVGIAAEDKSRIFERFFKADKARDRSLGGNGLGLSLVKKIIELHSGTITVESEQGKGTAFIVKLPRK